MAVVVAISSSGKIIKEMPDSVASGTHCFMITMWSETLELRDVRIISTYTHAGKG